MKRGALLALLALEPFPPGLPTKSARRRAKLGTIMNKYDTPPIVMASDPRTVFEDPDPARFAEAKIETKPARFIVFMGEHVWVARCYRTKRDYPWLSQSGAIAFVEHITNTPTDADLFTSSPADINAYGAPLENVEVLA
ncbi:hypothetical protein QDW34_gp53 [Microbacterium phage Burritobowl]|uniref:hypothetical protein n=1 Tax=Microbacterium phage Burritobowl TaxID=2762415 RepID=UPI00186036D5|nr:hypothetical protein QDW34_gp53 [Microbacterium phage Burritobowl]QNJ56211.1 hypothetical protein SEA_BURRITOBOWL_53 [Microbacterium phage Burritobowl]